MANNRKRWQEFGGSPAARILTITALIAAAALARLLPHPPNFTPIAAMALFAGAQVRDWRLALALPLSAMVLADVFIGPDGWLVTSLVYGCFAASVVMGMLIRKRVSFLSVATLSIASAILFYVVTNFGAWAAYTMYPKTLEGLWACYIAAIPFFGNTLAGNLCYSLLLFGGFALLEKTVPALRTKPTTSSSPSQAI